MKSYRIALAGNPNTGKSTLFNSLTGLRQHTGNWTGKTVIKAEGKYTFNQIDYHLIDLPGTYSLYSNSADEEVARDFILFEKPDVTVVVIDATSMERNLNLALQVMEMTDKVVICINLIDEAERKGISIDEKLLTEKLGVPVVKISARNRKGYSKLLKTISEIANGTIQTNPFQVTYTHEIEEKINILQPKIDRIFENDFPSRWIALRLLDGDENFIKTILQKRNGSKEGKIDGLSIGATSILVD